jgi:DNA polymerase-3 subunit delta
VQRNKVWSDPEDLERSVSKGKLYPLYYLYGNDQYLLERGVNQIRAMLMASLPETTVSSYSASETTPSAIINDARTISFFSGSRFMIVKEAHLFKSIHWKEFFPYLKNPVVSTTLIFLSEKMALEKDVYSLFRTKGMVVRLNHPFESQLPQWVKKIAQELKKELTPEATSLLLEVAGNDLLRIRSELEKVALYSGDEKLINAEAIKAVVVEAKIDTIFPLIECIGRKERDKSLIMLWSLINSGQSPLFILSLMSRQIRLIARAKEMILKGKGNYEVLKSLQIKGRPEIFIDQLSHFSSEEIKHIFAALAFTDLALKSSRLNRGMILEQLVLGICRGRA